MFGWGELGVVIILAIVLLGPDKLPEVFRTLGKVYYEYKKAKKRLELEVLYGYKIPDRSTLDQLSRKKIEELTKTELELESKDSDENIKKLMDPNKKEEERVDKRQNKENLSDKYSSE